MQRYASEMSKSAPANENRLVKLIRAQGDALALRADERRDKLRKASGRSKYL